MLEHPQENILCSSIIVGMMVFHLQLKSICAMGAFLRVFFFRTVDFEKMFEEFAFSIFPAYPFACRETIFFLHSFCIVHSCYMEGHSGLVFTKYIIISEILGCYQRRSFFRRIIVKDWKLLADFFFSQFLFIEFIGSISLLSHMLMGKFFAWLSLSCTLA